MFNIWLAPMVIAHRLPEIALETQRLFLGQKGKPGRPEIERMVTEKIAAANQGALALALEGVRSSVAIGVAASLGNLPRAFDLAAAAPSRLANAAAAPAHRTLKANHRRLRAK